jgi:dolichyl-phosphate-mannose-protein mannosyltransferase
MGGDVSTATVRPTAVPTRDGPSTTRGTLRRAVLARGWLALIIVWLAGGAYVGARLDEGWKPADEGVLGHSAEWVLQGKLPHRDFDDVYTGGLALFDAAVFRTFGTQLIALRVAMFVVFLLWIPAVYYIARRFAGPWLAAGVTLLCVVWSIPTYSAAMPSWYNLFLATFGMAALLRFTETRQRRWLVAAGVAGGLSILVKIVGLYYVAAVLLFLAFDEQRTAVDQSPGPGTGARPDRGYALLLTLVSALFIVGLLALVRAVPGASPLIQFVLPGASLVALLCAWVWRRPSALGWPQRLARLSALVGPFAFGLAVPIVAFLYPYLASGSMGALVRGVFTQPTKRLHFAVMSPPSIRTLPAALLWLLVLVPSAHGGDPGERRLNRLFLVAYAIILAGMIAVAARGGRPYIGVWLTVYYLVPCAVVAGCVVLVRRGLLAGEAAIRGEQVWLLLCMAALCSLIQVPYAGPDYILYVAPIAILALLAIVATQAPGSRARAALVAGFFLVFGVAVVNPGHIGLWDGAIFPRATWARVPLGIPRTGVKGNPIEAEGYQRLMSLIHAHSRSDGFIYAGPDCPELYFLSQRRDPTRTLFTFFDDPATHDARVLHAIDSLHITTVVINRVPMFSPRMDFDLDTALRARFPDSAVVYHVVVRWREGE